MVTFMLHAKLLCTERLAFIAIFFNVINIERHINNAILFSVIKLYCF